MTSVAEVAAASVTGEKLEIAEYTKRELRSLLADESFWAQPRLPITRRRAVSQVANPRAEENDPVLLTAHFQGQLVAYLGVLPDRVNDPSEGWIRFGWLTAWWADKESQQRLAAMKLLFAAMKRYGNRLAASSPASEAARAYVGSGRFEEHGRCGRSFFIVSLPPSWGRLSRAAQWVAGVKNHLISGRSLKRHGLQIQISDVFNEEMESFLNARAEKDVFGRDSAYWSWVLQYPWMSTTDEDQVAQKNYAFSVYAGDFRQIPMWVSRRGTMIAFLLMTLREGRLTLKHAYYDLADGGYVAAALRAAVADMNPWLFVCGDEGLEGRLRTGVPFHVARRVRHSVVYVGKVLPASPWLKPQPGTGDSVFT